MGLARNAVDNLRDARHIGPSFLMRHFNSCTHRSLTHARLKRVGPITIRNRTSDADVFHQVFATHQYELTRFPQFADIREFLDRTLAAGRTPLIIDLGANIGASPLWFASRFPECAIIAVEPDPTNAELCRRNLAHARNVEVIEAAIGSTSGRAELVDNDRGKWGISTVRSDTGALRVCTVAELLHQRADFCLFLVKIDIEGFERDLFASNTEWAAEAKVVIIEPHDWLLPGAGTSRSFQRVMGELDFDLLLAGENLVYVRRPDA
ncbi:MAG: FkbM family methyltransferase [Actinomycetota bacterium]|nr:FkbM family methyltransferase [Actinomycetota bacterium]